MLTYYTANKFLNVLSALSSGVSFTNSIYVGLSTTTPTAGGGNVTEPTGNGYARVLLGNTGQSLTQKMDTPADGAVTNKEIIYFPEATGSWGTLTHCCIFDHPTDGNLLAFAELSTPITPTANTIPIIRTGELEISLN